MDTESIIKKAVKEKKAVYGLHTLKKMIKTGGLSEIICSENVPANVKEEFEFAARLSDIDLKLSKIDRVW